MLFLCFSPVFLAINVFYAYEVFKWIDAITTKNRSIGKVSKISFGILWGFCSVSIFLAFLIPGNIGYVNHPFLYNLRRVLKHIGNYHLAVFFYIGMSLIVILICRLAERIYLKLAGISKQDEKQNYVNSTGNDSENSTRRAILGIINLVFIVSITLYGVWNAENIKINRYDVSVNKKVTGVKELRVVMVADLHMGYNIGSNQIAKMVDIINLEKPDVVLIAGDIFDNEYEALDDPDKLTELLSSIDSKYGVYAVYGNHDIDEKIIGGFTFDWNGNKESDLKMDELLESAGITLLMDDYVTICDEQIQIYGRPDYEKPGRGITRRLEPEEITSSLDLDKPIIVLDHEPRELGELSEAGVDIDLCGHTHDGQFFPMNLTSRYLTWENSAGLLKKGDMTNIVTSGVGLYGPDIRVGTQAEVCSIVVHFGE